MNERMRKKLLVILVFIIASGLAFSYFPFLRTPVFAPQEPPQNANETANVEEKVALPSASSSLKRSPQGFHGVEEEKKSLEDLQRELQSQ